jgi:hypothetical protein
MLKLKSNSTG